MTRTEAKNTIAGSLDKLTDEQLEALATLAMQMTSPSVYSTLSDSEKAALDTAIDQADRGEVLPWDTVSAQLEKKLKTAGV